MYMRITSYSNESVKLEGTEKEMDALRRAMLGMAWLKCEEGTVKTCEAPTPPFIVDKQLKFQWPLDPTLSISYHEVPPINKIEDGGIYVQHINGYDDNYKECAKKMEEVGFECLRSRRKSDGQIWEIWYLCGDFFAKGPCKDMKMKEIVNWVLENIRPGQLMTEGKRWALCID